MKEQVNNFLTKGYAHFNEKKLIDLSKFKIINVEINDELKNDFTPEEKILIDNFVSYVNENYVKTIYKKFDVTYCSIWDGVDIGSTKWHNDSVEGFDFNVLYYFDDTNEEVGGSIEFRHSEGDDIIYPKSGDLVFINQNGNFFHKASRSKNPRRVASIEYKVYE